VRRSLWACVAAALLLATSVATASAGWPGLDGTLIYSSSRGITLSDTDPGTRDVLRIAPRQGYDPAWSPDGRRFVVVIDGDLWVYAADGTHGKRITSGPTNDETPNWSPDGKRLIFGQEGITSEPIAEVSARGGSVKRLTHPPKGVFDFGPVWSPDGTRIAFQRDRQHVIDTYDIWLMRADGSGARAWAKDAGFEGYPAWSPDSTRLAYEQMVSGHKQVRIRPVDSGKAVTITDLPNAIEPDWSPDGAWIVVGNGKDGLVRVPVQGGEPVLITKDGFSPSWQPIPDPGPGPSCQTGASPDGTYARLIGSGIQPPCEY